jgi:hypothetical protein
VNEIERFRHVANGECGSDQAVLDEQRMVADRIRRERPGRRQQDEY